MLENPAYQNIPDPWNNLEVRAPPSCTAKTRLMHREMNEMITVLRSASNVLTNFDFFHKEILIFSNYLYRFKRIFRHDKGMRYMVQIYQVLKRYIKLDVINAVSQLSSSFPSKLWENESHDYLPTRQMIKFVLLRLLTLSKLMVRNIDLCKKSGRYLFGKLSLGWSKTYTAVALALVSRIHACSKYLLIMTQEWYDKMRPNLTYFEETVPYLPGFAFPNRLTEFIGDVDLSPPNKKTNIDELFRYISLTDRTDDDEDVTMLDDDDDNESEVKRELKRERDDDGDCDNAAASSSKIMKKEDLGCSEKITTSKVIKTEDFGSVGSNKKSFMKAVKKDDLRNKGNDTTSMKAIKKEKFKGGGRHGGNKQRRNQRK